MRYRRQPLRLCKYLGGTLNSLMLGESFSNPYFPSGMTNPTYNCRSLVGWRREVHTDAAVQVPTRYKILAGLMDESDLEWCGH